MPRKGHGYKLSSLAEPLFDLLNPDHPGKRDDKLWVMVGSNKSNGWLELTFYTSEPRTDREAYDKFVASANFQRVGGQLIVNLDSNQWSETEELVLIDPKLSFPTESSEVTQSPAPSEETSPATF
jgi:hypothetical protein